MKKLVLIILLFLFGISTLLSQTFIKGADLSYVKELESCGVQWKEDNSLKDILSIFKDNGANISRFRIWHTPVTGNNGYSDTESMISRAKAKGLHVMLDFHYSDTWADAGTQKCPQAWIGVLNNYSFLADSLYNYTKKTLQTLKEKGLTPEFVQVGNETNGGMCFPGNGTVTWPTDWSKQTLLFNDGIRAVRETDTSIKIILHVADPKNAEWWAGELKTHNVSDYDILGISYYPTYQNSKTINEFGTILTHIKNTYQKDVMVVETALPWTNSWDDNTTNILNGVPVNYGSDPTPEIQAQWLIDLTDKMVETGGTGIIYWEPDWVASHKNCPAQFGGSVWENVALFDFSNNLMNNGGINFCRLPTGISMENPKQNNFSLRIFPNPVNNELNAEINTNTAELAWIDIYDLQGRIINKFTKKLVPGSNTLALDIRNSGIRPGLFLLQVRLSGGSYQQSFILSR